MNWLSLLSDPERRAIRENLFASPEFFEAIGLALESHDAIKAGKCGLIIEELVCNAPAGHGGVHFHTNFVPNPDPVLTTAHGPILDLISFSRSVVDNIEQHVPETFLLEAAQTLRSAAAAAEAALPKVKL